MTLSANRRYLPGERCFLLFFLCFLLNVIYQPIYAFPKNTAAQLTHPELVKKFYAASNQQLYWMGTTALQQKMRATLLQKIDSAIYTGTDKRKYHYAVLLKINEELPVMKDSAALMGKDMLYTDAAIAYCKDLYQGSDINQWLDYDGISGQYIKKDNDFIVGHLAAVKSPDELAAFINSLAPASKEYAAYQAALSDSRLIGAVKTRQLTVSMNMYRWIHHFRFEKFIVVNIPSATLYYYENDTIALTSKVVVGKLKTPTPRFAAYCNAVILYPYWNVPRSIAVKELLPQFRRRPAIIDAMHMQVIDASGKVLNYRKLPWHSYTRSNFPYTIRQSTGCDNALGVIKFNITDPFNVYLHDTNFRIAFTSNYRYMSHGCIRVQQAMELGNYMLNNKLDTTFLNACIKGQKPVTLQLAQPVPVFVIYATAMPDNAETIKYYDDVYDIL